MHQRTRNSRQYLNGKTRATNTLAIFLNDCQFFSRLGEHDRLQNRSNANITVVGDDLVETYGTGQTIINRLDMN